MGVGLTALIAMALLTQPWLDTDAHPAYGLGILLGVSSCILLPVPLLQRTVLRHRRDPFVDNEDLDNLLLGRFVGLILGLVAAIWLRSMVSY